jgi:hypothetical protein
MSEKVFSADEAILVAKSAGLDTSDLERQTQRSETDADLQDKVASLEEKLREMRQQPSPEQQRMAIAESLRDALNDSLSKWHDTGGQDAA